MAELDFTQDKLDAVMVDPITGGRDYISDLIQERKGQIRDDMTIGEKFSDLAHRGARYGDANRKRFDDPPELHGKPVWTWEGRRREEDPRYQELFEMRDEYQREVDKNSGIMSGLRTLFDFTGIPTQADEVSFYTQNIPAGSLMEGLTGGGFSAGLRTVGEAEPIDIEATLTEYGVSPEVAGLGALAAGAMKGRGKGGITDIFKGLGDALDPSTIRKYDDKEFMDFQEGSEDVLGSLRRDRDQEWWDSPEADKLIRQDKWEGKRKIRKDPGVADELAKGGRPGTRRRKKIMVPSSYKAGGQVFQKGYYGKTYK